MQWYIAVFAIDEILVFFFPYFTNQSQSKICGGSMGVCGTHEPKVRVTGNKSYKNFISNHAGKG
jgi:hypothetical protein